MSVVAVFLLKWAVFELEYGAMLCEVGADSADLRCSALCLVWCRLVPYLVWCCLFLVQIFLVEEPFHKRPLECLRRIDRGQLMICP